MLGCKSSDVQIPGPFQPLVTHPIPRIAVVLQASKGKFQGLGDPAAGDIEPPHRPHDIDDLYAARTIHSAGIAGDAAPDGLVDRLLVPGFQIEVTHDLARAEARNQVPWTYTGAGAALQAAQKGFTHLGHYISNRNEGVFRCLLLDGS